MISHLSCSFPPLFFFSLFFFFDQLFNSEIVEPTHALSSSSRTEVTTTTQKDTVSSYSCSFPPVFYSSIVHPLFLVPVGFYPLFKAPKKNTHTLDSSTEVWFTAEVGVSKRATSNPAELLRKDHLRDTQQRPRQEHGVLAALWSTSAQGRLTLESKVRVSSH